MRNKNASWGQTEILSISLSCNINDSFFNSRKIFESHWKKKNMKDISNVSNDEQKFVALFRLKWKRVSMSSSFEWTEVKKERKKEKN